MPDARVNGNMLFYRESGEGPPAVFIHGFPLDHSLWLDQLKGLAHVRHCIAPDLRGFGRSEPMVDPVLAMEGLGEQRRTAPTGLLPTMSVRSVVIGGEDDELIPPAQIKELSAAIPGARTTIVPRAGHLTPIEQPDPVNQALIELFEGRKGG